MTSSLKFTSLTSWFVLQRFKARLCLPRLKQKFSSTTPTFSSSFHLYFSSSRGNSWNKFSMFSLFPSLPIHPSITAQWLRSCFVLTFPISVLFDSSFSRLYFCLFYLSQPQWAIFCKFLLPLPSAYTLLILTLALTKSHCQTSSFSPVS